MLFSKERLTLQWPIPLQIKGDIIILKEFFMEDSLNNWKLCVNCTHWASRGDKSSEYFCPYAKLKVCYDTDADECVKRGFFVPASSYARR